MRETRPARFPSALGSAALAEQKPEFATSPLCHVRMIVGDEQGNESFGCAADRLSVRWLDKRAGRDSDLKLRELVALLQSARDVYLAQPDFDSPFEQWSRCYAPIISLGRAANQEDLTSGFASALLERAMIDAVCRLSNQSLHSMLRNNQLGVHFVELDESLGRINLGQALPEKPTTTINIRHTVGVFDPFTDEDWPAASRIGDGLPETLQEYIDLQGLRYFKVKISGDLKVDLNRLMRLWEIMPIDRQPEITLDANEAFVDAEHFANFVDRLEQENLGLFQHILYFEQPLPRNVALDPKVAKWIRRINEQKPVIIDESDSTVDACKRALAIGYAGTSHKNCKGLFKSLFNYALKTRMADDDQQVILSGEDLQNLPIVPLQQDFVSVGILGMEHCERNGHHYNYGLSMLSGQEKLSVARHHPDLYEQRGDEWFMKIREGSVECGSLHGPGFGVVDEPDWSSMQDLLAWQQQL
jgi:hypothetical protein